MAKRTLIFLTIKYRIWIKSGTENIWDACHQYPFSHPWQIPLIYDVTLLTSLRIFLHTALQTATATELGRTEKMKSIFKCYRNVFSVSFSPKRLWFWSQQYCGTTALKVHLARIRRADSSPRSTITHFVWEKQLNFFEHHCTSFMTFKTIYFNSINTNWVPTVCIKGTKKWMWHSPWSWKDGRERFDFWGPVQH